MFPVACCPKSNTRGGGFSPLSLSPLIWLDASQLALSDGASVSSFTDMSGNGNHFVQATGVNQPVFRSSGINGIGAVEGDGAAHSMTLAAFGAQTSWWGMIMCQPVTMGSGKSLWGICDYPDAPVNYKILETNAATTINFNMAPGAAPTSVTLANATTQALLMIAATTTFRLAADSGADSTLTITTGTPGTQPDSGGRANNLMRLFGRGDGQYFNVRIGELLFGSGTLTAEQETALWAYLADKWGTSIP